MTERRREGLGRNRQSPGRRGFTIYHLMPPAMLIGAWFGYSYFTEPHRVFAKKHLECDPWDITWTVGEKVDVIRGCGRTRAVACTADGCIDVEAPVVE